MGGFRPPADDDVLTTERLEIVEPDGQPVFVLPNSERPAVGTMDGEPYVRVLDAEGEAVAELP